jgi:hypothetical protein
MSKKSVLRRSSTSKFSIGDRHGKCEYVKISSVYIKCVYEDVKNGILACKIVSCVNVTQRKNDCK